MVLCLTEVTAKNYRNASVANTHSFGVPVCDHVGDGALDPVVATVVSATPRLKAPEPGKRFAETLSVKERGVVSESEFAALMATIEMTVA